MAGDSFWSRTGLVRATVRTCTALTRCGLAAAQARGLPWVYLGYFVEGCSSLEYNARYTPNEVFDWASGEWVPFR